MVETESLLATLALEMDMVIFMVVLFAFFFAKCIFHDCTIINHFMNQAFFIKGFERSINSYSIEISLEKLFNLAMRKSYFLL